MTARIPALSDQLERGAEAIAHIHHGRDGISIDTNRVPEILEEQ